MKGLFFDSSSPRQTVEGTYNMNAKINSHTDVIGNVIFAARKHNQGKMSLERLAETCCRILLILSAPSPVFLCDV